MKTTALHSIEKILRGPARRWLFPLIVVLYAALFSLLFGALGRGIGALAIVPVIAVGWLWGTKAGIIAALCTLPVNIVLAHLLGQPEPVQLFIQEHGGIAGTIALILIGTIVGRLSELRRRVRRELAERKEAERKLLEINEFFENILESSLDAIAVTDENGFLTRVNRSLLNLLGYTEQEVIGKRMYAFSLAEPGTYPSSTGAAVVIDETFLLESTAVTERFLETGSISNWESYYLHKSGHVIPVEQNVVLLYTRENRLIGSVGFIRDITQRRQAEEILRTTSQTLQSLIASSPLAIVVLDRTRVVSLWNPAAGRIFGWSESEAINQPLPFIHETTGNDFQPVFEQVLAGTAVTDAEMRVTCKNGTMIDISLSLAPLFDKKGGVLSCMAIASDITEPRRLQREILEVSGREQRRIGQDLHDGLGQVLTGVTFLGRALGQKLSAKKLPEAREAEEITRLVNEAISQTRAMARGLHPVTLESDGLLAALEELAADTENMFAITCIFSYNAPLLFNNAAVAVHLYRIAQEAVSNAVRHGGADSIAIELTVGQGSHTLGITDDGAGMSAMPRPRRGMGINLMHYRARIIGAKLSVQSVPGDGTTVTCVFQIPNLSEPRVDNGHD